MKTAHALLISAAVFSGLVAIAEFADSQVPQVTVVGAVTAGHCAGFSSTLQLQDTGAFCGTSGVLITGGFNTLSLNGQGTGVNPSIVAAGGDANVGISTTTKGNGSYFFTGNNFGTNLFQINGSTTATDFLTVNPGNGGATLFISGSSTNDTLSLAPKGNGQINLGVAGANTIVQVLGATSGAAQFESSSTGGHLCINCNNGGVAPTLTAGCNGAGSSVSGSDATGTVTGSTAAATTCTLSFGTAYGAAPNCSLDGLSSPLTGAITVGTGSIVVNFASTANYKWSYICFGQ